MGGSSTKVSCEFVYMLLCCTAPLSDVCFWRSCLVKCFFLKKKSLGYFLGVGVGSLFFFLRRGT